MIKSCAFLQIGWAGARGIPTSKQPNRTQGRARYWQKLRKLERLKELVA
jgi:hypothetical protein